LFDIEIIFLLPWCVDSLFIFWNGWLVMIFFFQFLLLGFCLSGVVVLFL